MPLRPGAHGTVTGLLTRTETLATLGQIKTQKERFVLATRRLELQIGSIATVESGRGWSRSYPAKENGGA